MSNAPPAPTALRMRPGQFNFYRAPATATGTVDWATGLRIEFDLDLLSGLRKRR